MILVFHLVVNLVGELFVLTPVGWYLKSEFGAVNWWFVLLLIQRLWLAFWHKGVRVWMSRSGPILCRKISSEKEDTEIMT